MTNLIAEGYSIYEARNLVFKRDIEAIVNSDILIAVLDGRTIDEGVAFELGYANALGKPCFGLKTDDRTMLPSGDNPMIVMACNNIFSNLSEMIVEIKQTIEQKAWDRVYPLLRNS